MSLRPVSYKRHRFPPAIIAHAVWLYFRFPLRFPLVEEMLLGHGIVVCYETARCWAMKFGRDYAGRHKRKRPSPATSGTSTWSAQTEGLSLSSVSAARSTGCGAPSTRTAAARRLPRRLLKKQGLPPRRMITDKLGSYAAARRQIIPGIEHRSHKGLNNRAENSHLPLRRRERTMQGFRSPRLAAVHRCLLRRPQSFRSILVPSLRPCHPSPSTARHGAMGGRGRHRRLSPSRGRIRLNAPAGS